jgi:outer membrane protein
MDISEKERDMKQKLVLLSVLAVMLLVPMMAGAQDTGWAIKLRAVDLYPNSSSSYIDGSFTRIRINDAWSPELAVNYKWHKNWGAELSLTSARHDMDLVSGMLNGMYAGSVDIMPLALTGHYYFTTKTPMKPYIGLGFNYTQISSFHASSELRYYGVRVDLENSFGITAQVGSDFLLGKNWFINADVTYHFMGTYTTFRDAYSVNKVDTTLNAVVWGVGVGYRF